MTYGQSEMGLTPATRKLMREMPAAFNYPPRDTDGSWMRTRERNRARLKVIEGSKQQ